MSETIICARCERHIDCCAFCDGHECTECICYRCLMYHLGEARVIVPRDEPAP